MNATEEHWELARSIQITPTTETLPHGRHGVITIRQHAAGWFISARYPAELSDADRADFAQFVMVRTYLLLEQGPRPHLWESVADGCWRSYCLPAHIDLYGAVPITA